MKILFASITDTGIKRVRSELIAQLLSLKHEVIVVVPKGNAVCDLEHMGCCVIPIEIQQRGTNPYNDIRLYNDYKKILRKINPDIVLTFTTKPNVYCGMAARKYGIPVIMNITGMGTALSNKGILQNILLSLYRKATNGNNIKCIFFQNDDSREFFRQHKLGCENVYRRIPGSGVNLSKYIPLPYPNDETIHFLFVARVLKEKGIEEYVSAATKIKENFPNTEFHVLGNCDEKYKEFVEQHHRNGIINYHGQVNNIADYQEMSHCTIHPSYYPEGMSNVILEAAASGRPVITTDHPGCRDGVDNGKTGFIVAIKSSEELVNAITRFLEMSNDERREMGLAGREKMEKEFDRQIVTNAYLNMI